MGRRVSAGRLSALVARPGIDTRYHIVLAVIDKVRVDPVEGVFADVSFLPSEEPESALLGVPYAGNGFGLYCPLYEDDVVLIAIPDGDPASGPVIIARMWCAADPPPPEIKGTADSENQGQFHPSDDVVLRAKPGANTKIVVSEGANVTITVEGSGNVNLVVNGGNVNLGQDSHGEFDGVVHGSGIDPMTGANYTALGNTSSKVWAKKS